MLVTNKDYKGKEISISDRETIYQEGQMVKSIVPMVIIPLSSDISLSSFIYYHMYATKDIHFDLRYVCHMFSQELLNLIGLFSSDLDLGTKNQLCVRYAAKQTV